jgi:hypothetical protein
MGKIHDNGILDKMNHWGHVGKIRDRLSEKYWAVNRV